MTKQQLALGFGFLLATACGTLPPPASAPAASLEMRLDPPPVHALFGYRAELQLTSEQIDALDALGQEAHAKNHPLLSELSMVQQNGGMFDGQQRILTLAAAIHQNNVQVMEEVREVLTERQRERACGLFQGSRFKARGLRTIETAEIATRGLQRTGSQVTVATQTGDGAIWSWCGDSVASTASR